MMSFRAKLLKIPVHAILIFFSIISIFPFYYIIVTAFKTDVEYYENTYAPPARWVFENIIKLVRDQGFLRSTLNSIIVTFLSILITLVISGLAAFAYSRMKFKFKEFLLSFTVSLTSVPIIIVLIPIYVLAARTKMLDSYLGVSLVYATFMLPICIFLLTSFFKSIPQELFDAASIDGCSRLQMLYKIVLPLSTPIITTLVVVNAAWVWNELLLAMVFLKEPEMTTVTAAFGLIAGQHGGVSPVLIQAGALFVVIPMILLFLAGQRYFRRGLFSGAIKE